MLLVVSKDSYRGRFLDRARDLIAKGGVVGYIHVAGTNYVHCPVCPANFAPPSQACQCCRNVATPPRAKYGYEFGTIIGVRIILFCKAHLHTFERFAGTIHEENHNDAWGECPGCKIQCIFEWEK